MLSSYFTLILALFCFSYASAAPKFDKDQCGCFATCETKYSEQTKEVIEQRDSCQRGCRLFRLVGRVPHKNPTKEEKSAAAENCSFSCIQTLSVKSEMDACMEGCRNGCDYVFNLQPRVKLTILVDDPLTSGSETVDMEPILFDPALKKQIDEAMHVPPVKPKIPSSYFTNLPIIRGSDHGCHTEFRLCENWLISEPLLCTGLLIMAVGLLMAAYWRRSKPKVIDADQAPILPEKVPLQISM